MRKPIFTKWQQGSSLVTLLFFVIIAITISTGAITVLIINSLGTGKFEQGNSTHALAESGIENALMRILRDPSYSGETMTTANGSIEVVVTGTSTKTITATSTQGNFKRAVQVQATYANNQLSITSWKEQF